MSRPTSAKSVAWSDDPPVEEPVLEAPESPAKEAKIEEGYSKELEEELNRDITTNDNQNEPVGCWASFTNMISSKFSFVF